MNLAASKSGTHGCRLENLDIDGLCRCINGSNSYSIRRHPMVCISVRTAVLAFLLRILIFNHQKIATK